MEFILSPKKPPAPDESPKLKSIALCSPCEESRPHNCPEATSADTTKPSFTFRLVATLHLSRPLQKTPEAPAFPPAELPELQETICVILTPV